MSRKRTRPSLTTCAWLQYRRSTVKSGSGRPSRKRLTQTLPSQLKRVTSKLKPSRLTEYSWEAASSWKTASTPKNSVKSVSDQ